VLTIGTGLGNARFTNRRKEGGNGKDRDTTETGRKQENGRKKGRE
jgi:hypothetical protein